MILSELIFDISRTENIIKIPVEEMRQIIKTEIILEKFFKVREQQFGRKKIE